MTSPFIFRVIRFVLKVYIANHVIELTKIITNISHISFKNGIARCIIGSKNSNIECKANFRSRKIEIGDWHINLENKNLFKILLNPEIFYNGRENGLKLSLSTTIGSRKGYLSCQICNKSEFSYNVEKKNIVIYFKDIKLNGFKKCINNLKISINTETFETSIISDDFVAQINYTANGNIRIAFDSKFLQLEGSIIYGAIDIISINLIHIDTNQIQSMFESSKRPIYFDINQFFHYFAKPAQFNINLSDSKIRIDVMSETHGLIKFYGLSEMVSLKYNIIPNNKIVVSDNINKLEFALLPNFVRFKDSSKKIKGHFDTQRLKGTVFLKFDAIKGHVEYKYKNGTLIIWPSINYMEASNVKYYFDELGIMNIFPPSNKAISSSIPIAIDGKIHKLLIGSGVFYNNEIKFNIDSIGLKDSNLTFNSIDDGRIKAHSSMYGPVIIKADYLQSLLKILSDYSGLRGKEASVVAYVNRPEIVWKLYMYEVDVLSILDSNPIKGIPVKILSQLFFNRNYNIVGYGKIQKKRIKIVSLHTAISSPLNIVLSGEIYNGSPYLSGIMSWNDQHFEYTNSNTISAYNRISRQYAEEISSDIKHMEKDLMMDLIRMSK